MKGAGSIVPLVALGAALFCGGVAAAGKAGEHPPIAVLRPEDNPLSAKCRGARVPVPTIVWEDIRVRPDHPRLLLTQETLPSFREHFRRHRLRGHVARLAYEGDPLACAFMYQMTGRKSYADVAIRALLSGVGAVGGEHWGLLEARDIAYLYDWTYEAMSDAERKEAVGWRGLDVWDDAAAGWPICAYTSGYPADARPSETKPEQWMLWYNFTLPDDERGHEWYRDALDEQFARLLALAGHKPRMAESVRNCWEFSLKDIALLHNGLRDGGHVPGIYWAETDRLESLIRTFLHARSATGLDYVNPEQHPYLANIGRWMLYCSDPWEKRLVTPRGPTARAAGGRTG